MIVVGRELRGIDSTRRVAYHQACLHHSSLPLLVVMATDAMYGLPVLLMCSTARACRSLMLRSVRDSGNLCKASSEPPSSTTVPSAPAPHSSSLSSSSSDSSGAAFVVAAFFAGFFFFFLFLGFELAALAMGCSRSLRTSSSVIFLLVLCLDSSTAAGAASLTTPFLVSAA